MRDAGRVVVVLVAVLCATVASAEAPVAVSPGHADQLVQVEGRCQTFLWGAVPDAASYQLVVYRLGEEGSGEEAKPVVRATVPGSATGWTPALGQCLERGGRYAWAVRAVGKKEASDWSTPALFQVAAPTQAEFEEALAVVRSYLALQDGTGGDPAPVTEAESPAEPDLEPAVTADAPGTRTAAATALKVDLGVEAASFKGDGSELTALTPENLAGGTAAIDISGNAATATTATTASDLACTDCVSESELDFDPSSQAELDAHKVSSDHDAAYVNTSGDTMTGALSMGSNTITEIGAPGTSFTATGGLTLSDDLEISKVLVMPHTVDSTTGVIYKHSSTPPPGSSQTFLHNFNVAGTEGFNLFLGVNAGNFTMSSGSTPDVLDASYNTGIGTDVLHANTTGNANTATGSSALSKNTTGFRNTAHGTWALINNITGSGNTAGGVDALYSNTTGGSNTAFGLSALWTNTIGASNTAVGADALLYGTTGEENIALGFKAGESLTTGSHNIIIGVDIDVPADTGNDQMNIGNLIFGTGVDGKGSTLSSGNVGIGTSSPAQKLDVVGSVQATGFLGDGSGLTGVSADTAANSSLLDSLDSTQFLRSDTSDSLTSGTLTLEAGTTLDVDGAVDASGATGITLPATTIGGDVSLANGETISNSTDEVIRFSDGTDTFDIDLSGSVSLASGDGVVTVPGQLIAERDNASSLRTRGPEHPDGGSDATQDTVQSYMGIFYNDAYQGTSASTSPIGKTRAIFGANYDMDLEIQGPHGVRITAVDDTKADGHIRMASKTNMTFHAGASAETDALVATVDSSGLTLAAGKVLSGDGSGLTGVSPAAHLHDGADVATGTVADARIDGALARDAEVFGIVTGADGAGSGLDADLLDGQDSSAFTTAGSAWLLAGNAGTTPGTDFIGTTDPQPLELHANSMRLMSLDVGAVPISEPSMSTPVYIPDNSLPGVTNDIGVPDVGIATTFKVALHLNNSDFATLRVELTDPDAVGYVLFDGGPPGPGDLDTSYPVPTPTVSGDLTTWVGRNPAGTWQIKIIDTGDDGAPDPGNDGQLMSWSIEFDVLGDPNVQVFARLAVDGEVNTTGSFSGVGIGLTGLNASNLEFGTVPTDRLAGTYNIDITGNAATASAATALAANPPNCPAGQAPNGVSETGNVEGCFDVATQSELDTHKLSGDHDGAYVNVAGDTMMGSLDMNGGNSVENTAAVFFEGATADANEAQLAAVDPTADRVLLLPDVSGTLATTNSDSIPASALQTEVRSVWIGAQLLSSDGAQCQNFEANIGHKLHYIQCADNDSATFSGTVGMPDGWDGEPVVFELQALNVAGTPTGDLVFELSAQCRGDGDVVGGNYSSPQSVSMTFTTQKRLEHVETSPVTPLGTCAGGDSLLLRGRLDADPTTTQTASTYIVGVKIEYTTNIGD